MIPVGFCSAKASGTRCFGAQALHQKRSTLCSNRQRHTGGMGGDLHCLVHALCPTELELYLTWNVTARAELNWDCSICSWSRIVRERWDSMWTGNCFQFLQWELEAILDKNLTFLKSLCESQCTLKNMHSFCVIFLWKYWNKGFQIQIPGDFLQVSDKVVLKSLARDYWLCRSHMC